MHHQKLLKEGIDCLNQLKRIDPNTTKLGAEVLYNFICIGVETVLTAVLIDRNCTVDHSGIFRMLKELEKTEPVDQEWLDCSKYMTRFQTYCSLDPIPAKIPNIEEMKRLMNFGLSVQKYGEPKMISE